MELLREIKLDDVKITEIEVSPFTYKHLRMLQKKEYQKENEIKFKVIENLIKSITLEGGKVISDRDKITEFVNIADLYNLTGILIEAKKLEIEPEDGRYYVKQNHECSNCNKIITLPFDVTEPLQVASLEDSEFKGKKVYFKLPTKKDEQYLIRNMEEDVVDGLFRLYVKQIDDSTDFDNVPATVIREVIEYLEKNTKHGYVKEYDFTCHSCEKEFKKQLDTSIERFFE